MRVTKVIGDMLSELSEILVLCKSIAHVLTVINQPQKEGLRILLGQEMQVLASVAQENVCHVPQAQPAPEAEVREAARAGMAVPAAEVCN